MAHVAHAAERQSGWVSRPEQAARQGRATPGFLIKNDGREDWVVDGAWTAGPTTKMSDDGVINPGGPLGPDDSVPPDGTVLKPDSIEIEVEHPWRGGHEVVVQLRRSCEYDVHRDMLPVGVTLLALNGMRASHARSATKYIGSANGGNVWLR